MDSNSLKLQIEDRFFDKPQKVALAVGAVDGIYAGIATLASLGLVFVLVEPKDIPAEPVDTFPLMLHGADGASLTVHSQDELDDALASGAGWVEKTEQQVADQAAGEAIARGEKPAPGPVEGAFGDFSPTIEGAAPEEEPPVGVITDVPPSDAPPTFAIPEATTTPAPEAPPVAEADVAPLSVGKSAK